MQDSDSDHSRPKGGRKPRPWTGGRIGKTVALVVIWIGILYIVVVGFFSIIPQVFAPEMEPMAYESCAEGVRALRRELLGRMSEEFDRADPQSDLRPFLQEWDRRKHGLREQCEDTDAVDSLSRLRYRAETHARRYAREQGPLLDRLDREIEEIEQLE